jgi:hypothetical protein
MFAGEAKARAAMGAVNNQNVSMTDTGAMAPNLIHLRTREFNPKS